MALDVCAAVLEPILEGYDNMTGQGRCMGADQWLLIKVGEVLLASRGGAGARDGAGDAAEYSERAQEVRVLGAQLCAAYTGYCGAPLSSEGIEMFMGVLG